MTDLSDLGEDMLARARRGTLEPEEQRELRELLAESSEARLLFDAGSVFDREAVVLPGDDLRVEKMIRAVRARDARRRPRAMLRTHWRALAVRLRGDRRTGRPRPLPRSAFRCRCSHQRHLYPW